MYLPAHLPIYQHIFQRLQLFHAPSKVKRKHNLCDGSSGRSLADGGRFFSFSRDHEPRVEEGLSPLRTVEFQTAWGDRYTVVHLSMIQMHPSSVVCMLLLRATAAETCKWVTSRSRCHFIGGRESTRVDNNMLFVRASSSISIHFISKNVPRFLSVLFWPAGRSSIQYTKRDMLYQKLASKCPSAEPKLFAGAGGCKSDLKIRILKNRVILGLKS